MIKKVSLAVLLFGFIGVIVWGGVIRTQAKSGEVVDSSQSGGRWGENGTANNNGNSEDSRSQIHRGNDHAGEEDCNENSISDSGYYGSLESGETQGMRGNQDDRSNSDKGQGSGFRGWKNDISVYGNSQSGEHLDERDLSGGGYYGDLESGESQGTRGNRDDGTNSDEGQSSGYRGGKNISSGNSNGRGGEPLDESEIEALFLALDDEYHALAVYQSVLSKFGEIEPFVEIAQSEQRHINALLNQFAKHGISAPENTWFGNIPPLDSIQSACQLGVEAETANVDLYQKLFFMVDDPSLIQVFTNLSNASQDNHLPEFQECQ